METSARIPYLIKQIELGLRPHLDAAVQPHDLTAAQYTALTVLQRRPGITSSELARRSFVRAQTMAETVTFLVAESLVRRELDPTHRRRVLLFLTDLGADRIARLAEPVDAVEALLVEDLSEKERAQLVDYLRRCRNALSAHPGREHIRPAGSADAT